MGVEGSQKGLARFALIPHPLSLRKVLTMKAIDLTFLESVSSSTLNAWLDASNRETVRLQRELDATRAAKSALIAEITRRNRKRVGLPPLVNIPVKAKEGAEQGWVTLELETVPKVCGNCAQHMKTPECPQGWCSWLDMPQSAHSPSGSCTHFDPMPLPSTPPTEAVKALDHLPTPEEMDDARR